MDDHVSHALNGALSQDGLRLALWEMRKAAACWVCSPTGTVYFAKSETRPELVHTLDPRLITFFEPFLPYVGFWSFRTRRWFVVNTDEGRGAFATPELTATLNRTFYDVTESVLNLDKLVRPPEECPFSLLRSVELPAMTFKPHKALWLITTLHEERGKQLIRHLLTNANFQTCYSRASSDPPTLSMYSEARQVADYELYCWNREDHPDDNGYANYSLGQLCALLPIPKVSPGEEVQIWTVIANSEGQTNKFAVTTMTQTMLLASEPKPPPAIRMLLYGLQPGPCAIEFTVRLQSPIAGLKQEKRYRGRSLVRAGTQEKVNLEDSKGQGK